MATLRRHLPWIVCAWLVCQIGVLAAAPLSLAGMLENAGAEAVLCTCASASGPGHYCPMHANQSHAGSGHDSDDCVVGSAGSASDVALMSLTGGVGLVPPAQTALATVVTAEPIPAIPAAVLSRSDRPDAPPPRPSHPVDLS